MRSEEASYVPVCCFVFGDCQRALGSQSMTASLPPTTRSGNMTGIGLMVLATMAMVIQHSMVKQLAGELSILEIVFFRTVAALLFFMPWILRSGLAIFQTDKLGLHLLRAFFQSCSAFAFFLGLAIVPLATVTALHFTTPLFAVLIGIITLGERVSIRRWTAIAAGFVGTLIILRPNGGSLGYGELLVLGSAVAWAAAIIVIKILGRTDSSITITAYMYLLMTPITLIAAVFDWRWPTGQQYLWLLGIGLTGALGHVFTAEALKRAPTHVVTPLDFFRLVWATLIGLLLFDEAADFYVWGGGAIVIASVSYIVLREHQVSAVRRRL
jgi:drug/metabolite transporter (DMT)-like permease